MLKTYEVRFRDISDCGQPHFVIRRGRSIEEIQRGIEINYPHAFDFHFQQVPDAVTRTKGKY